MTEKEKQRRAEVLKDQLVDCLFQTPDGQFNEAELDEILDELDELEPLELPETEAMLEQFWDTVEMRSKRFGDIFSP